MHPWKAHLARTWSGEGRVFQDGRSLFGVVWKTLELGHNSGHVSRVTPPHEHNLTGAFVNATLLTYLLNGEILLFIQTWPSQQKRTLGDRTRYSAARGRPHRNDSASFTTTSLDLGGAFDHKNFIGVRLANCGRPWMTAREELLFTTRRCPWQRDAAEPAPSMPRCIQGISPLPGGYCGVPPPLPPPPPRPPCRAALQRTLGVSPRAIVVKSEIERPSVAGSEISRPIVRGPIVFISETNRPIVLGHAPIVLGSIVVISWFLYYLLLLQIPVSIQFNSNFT